MSTDAIDVFGGDCTVSFADAGEVREERGAVLVLAKPDGTVLIHDRAGYRPVAWLTRAERVSIARDGPTPTLEAEDGGRTLTVTCHEAYGRDRFATTRAGRPVGACPECDGTLVRSDRDVECLGCRSRYGLPRGAAVLDSRCPRCGLPRMRVDRGAAFEVCIDRTCESLDAAVIDRFDRVWTCPSCGGDLRILRRGGLIAGCEHYPDCETGFALRAGLVDDPCGTCGLPTFTDDAGTRCLDSTCPG